MRSPRICYSNPLVPRITFPEEHTHLRIVNADKLSSHGNAAGRRAVLEILEASMQAADPYYNTLKLLRREGNKLIVGNPDFEPTNSPQTGPEVIDLDRIGRVFVFGACKGIQSVAKAIEEVLGDRLTGGHVIAKHGDDLILERIGVTFGAHPVPDEGCAEGCRRIQEMCRDLREDDLVFTIVGNGVSSLLTLPSPGISVEDVRQMTYLMQIDRGAPTQDLNQVRNMIDQMKSGRISRHIQPAMAIHILAYDPDANSMRPGHGYDHLMHENRFLHTLPSYTSYESASAALKKWQAWDETPRSIRDFLLRGDPEYDTVKAPEFQRMRSRIFGVMPRRIGTVPTAARKARELGYAPHVMSRLFQAEARAAGYAMSAIALSVEREGTPFEPPCALITSGELLVTVGDETGVGGRNQEYALGAALKIAGSENVVVGAVDTDGTDGPGTQFSEHARHIPCLTGGLVDGQTAGQAKATGVDLFDHLRRHDTTPALWALDSGIVATHNIAVGDLGVVLIQGRSSEVRMA